MPSLFDAEPEERKRRLADALNAAAGKPAGTQRMILAAAVVALEDEWVAAATAALARTLTEGR